MFETDIALSIEDVRNLMRPCVYLFWLGSVVQYVGMSRNGIIRPLSPDHPSAGFASDKLEILWQPDEETARMVEGQLIWKYSPQFNTQQVASLSRRSSGVPMPHKGWDCKTQEFLVVSETGETVFRSKDKALRSTALSAEMRRYRKSVANMLKEQARA